MPPQVRPLIWNDAAGDTDEDRVLEARENPADPASEWWQITLHDLGPSWDWYRYDASGDLPLDVGFGESVEHCKRQIEERRRR